MGLISWLDSLNESPIIDDGSNLGHDSQFELSAFNHIEQLHHTTKQLGDSVFHQKTRSGNDDLFYHLNKKSIPDVVSKITDEDERGDPKNTQLSFNKKQGTPSEYVHLVFSKALSVMKEIHSDNSHTPGSKKFWLNIHKNIPNLGELHHIDENGNEHRATPEYLKQNENKIWGYHDKEFNQVLRARVKE